MFGKLFYDQNDMWKFWFCVLGIFLTSRAAESVRILERGDNITLECPYNTTAQSVTWQETTYNTPTNLSTCSVSTGNCTNLRPDIYEADFLNTSVLTLNITGVRLNETNFRCVANDGTISGNTTLEVYVWPTTDGGRLFTNSTTLEITINITSYYPDIDKIITRKEANLTSEDIQEASCSRSIGPLRSAVCRWVMPMYRMLPASTFVVLVSSKVSDPSQVKKAPEVAMNFFTTIDVPVVVIKDCTYPTMLEIDTNNTFKDVNVTDRNGTNSIEALNHNYTGRFDRKDRTTSCACSLYFSNQKDYLVQWFSSAGRPLGQAGYVSRLTIVYDKSDPTPIYECRAMVGSQAFLYGRRQLRPQFFGSSGSSWSAQISVAMFLATTSLLLLI